MIGLGNNNSILGGVGFGPGRQFLSGFDPLSLNPFIALDFGLPTSRALKTGGTQAGYLDLVPTWENPGSGSDATQGTSGSQPLYLAHTGRNYLHLPGITGNTISVPFGVGTYDYLITYVDNITSNGSIDSAAGAVTVGSFGAAFANKQIWKIRLSLTGTTVAEFLADSATHRAATFVDSYAKTWTVNITGNNPAVVVGLPMLRNDGVDDFLSGTFASAITCGRMFAVFSVNGLGGSDYDRIFTAISDAGDSDGAAGSYLYSLRDGSTGNVLSSYTRSPTAAELTFAAATYSGRIYHEVLAAPLEASARRNNDSLSSALARTINATKFVISGGSFIAANSSAAIDIEALYLLPAATSAADVASMRSYLNTRHNLGLTLP